VRLDGGTQAGAASVPIIWAVQTWNNATTVFTGLLLNVTSTASGATSKFIDLQLAGVSQFSVTKAGAMTVAGTSSLQAVTAATLTATVDYATGFALSAQAITGTGPSVVQIKNGTSDVRLGVIGSGAGVVYSGSSAYSAFIGNVANQPLDFFTNDIRRGGFSGAGAFDVTSGLTVSAGGITVGAGTSALQALTATTIDVVATNVGFSSRPASGTLSTYWRWMDGSSTVVGRIGYLGNTSSSGVLYIANDTAGGSVHFGATSVVPDSDNATALGAGGLRWTAVYAVNGTIQTSLAERKNLVAKQPARDDVLAAIRSADIAAFTYKGDKGFNAAGHEHRHFGVMHGSLPRWMQTTDDGLNPMSIATLALAGVRILDARLAALEAPHA
jgi:hypothetical protein